MAGSHRAPRGGGRAAAREARRQKARKRNQTIAAGSRGRGAGRRRRSRGAERVRRRQLARPEGRQRPVRRQVDRHERAGRRQGAARRRHARSRWPRPAPGRSPRPPTAAPPRSSAFVCQSQRFADPAGLRTWVRTFQNATTKDTAVQYVEVSNDKAAAAKAYTSIVGWLSQCSAPQTRLTSSYVTTGVGERGVIAVFGQPSGTKTQYKTIAVTLAGQATMVLEHDTLASYAAQARTGPGRGERRGEEDLRPVRRLRHRGAGGEGRLCCRPPRRPGSWRRSTCRCWTRSTSRG